MWNHGSTVIFEPELGRDINKCIEDRFQLALQHAEGNARDIVQGELKDRSVAHEYAFAQSEARVVALVRGIIDQYDSAARKRQAQQSEDITDHVEERLRQVVIVAKSASETKALEMVAKQVSATVLACSSTVTSTASACTSTADPAKKITTYNKSKPRPERRLERKKRAQVDEVREDEAGRVLRRQERRGRAKIDRIQKEAQAAVLARAATRAAELLDPKPKVRV
ncbi:hypothetical protein P3T76_012341 [Phytophthora citrophthora]|uniref:Uncharacterized protein n=1 Tax=Phytophthora citrophthora TaxID=4793 RepID=A0AAD9LE17_9STRA|nr:hypothetical protein P3T76_012341 [Phytophthora citrophthora]